MYKAKKYRRNTAETTGSSRFLDNFHGITSEDASQPPSLTTASTSDISELVIAFSSAADAHTAQITALMAAMMDQQLPKTNSNTRRNNPQKEINQRVKRTEKPNSYYWPSASQGTWITIVARVTTSTRANRVMPR